MTLPHKLCMLALVCVAAMPPVPKLPVKLESPKGAEFTKSLAKVAAPLAIVVPAPLFTNTFTWGPVSNQFIAFGKLTNGCCLYSNVVIVQVSPTIPGTWSNCYTGQLSSFTLVSTNPETFCRLKTAWKPAQ